MPLGFVFVVWGIEMAVLWGFCGFGIRIVWCVTVTFWNTKHSMYVWQRGRANLRLVVFCVGPDAVGPPENRQYVVSSYAFLECDDGVQISQSSQNFKAWG